MIEFSNIKNLSQQGLIEAFGEKLQFNKNLTPFTGFKTGGEAALFINAETEIDCATALKAANNMNIPYFLIGGGTNILISDSGFDGLILKIDIKGLAQTDDTVILCGAGEDLENLVEFSAENSLTGLEFAAGIVGSVGGAIYGNAGAYGGEIGSVIDSFTVINSDGVLKEFVAKDGEFSYRDSILKKTKDIVVNARFRLKKGDKLAIRAKIDDILKTRHEKLPYDECSAGCFFKNIVDETQPHGKLAAGKLLDEIGAKGMSFGGAKVSDKHANIIINTGQATSQDIKNLADKLKKKVMQKFGIILEEEVIHIGNF